MTINLRRELNVSFDEAVERTTLALKESGFGVLTRIDLDAKIKEKIGKELPRVAILGACNPSLAYEAYCANSDVASLLPCNAVVKDIGGGRVAVELARPSVLMRILGDKKLEEMAAQADERLERALERV